MGAAQQQHNMHKCCYLDASNMGNSDDASPDSCGSNKKLRFNVAEKRAKIAEEDMHMHSADASPDSCGSNKKLRFNVAEKRAKIAEEDMHGADATDSGGNHVRMHTCMYVCMLFPLFA